MRRRGKRLLLTGLLLSSAICGGAVAAPPEASGDTLRLWTIDGEHSDVQFGLRVLFRRLQGRFLSLRGKARREPDSDRVELDIQLDSNSVWMSKESQARWARSAEFFDAEDYPHIEFLARNVPMQTVREGGKLQGIVRMRGHESSIDVKLLPSDCDQPGERCPVRARATVSRLAFGMNSKRWVVGDEVELQFSILLLPAADNPEAEHSR